MPGPDAPTPPERVDSMPAEPGATTGGDVSATLPVQTHPPADFPVPVATQGTVQAGTAQAEEGSALQRVTADLDFVSDRLSSQVRSISIGVIALVWAVSVGDLKNGVAPPQAPLLAIGAAAVLTMGFDFLQYVAAYWSGQKALKSAVSGGDGLFDPTWRSYRLRAFFFWVKLCSAALTGLAMIVVLGNAVLHSRTDDAKPNPAEPGPAQPRGEVDQPASSSVKGGSELPKRLICGTKEAGCA